MGSGLFRPSPLVFTESFYQVRRLCQEIKGLLGVLLVLLLAGCDSTNLAPPGDAPRAGGELIVSAAASLKDAFNEIGQLYESRNPTKVRFNFGASGVLQKQIESAAPADVFASAGARQMDEIAARGLIDQTSRKDFVRNVLVLAVPADSSAGIRSFSDLSNPQVSKVAAGNPKTVPAGQYTEQALTRMNLLPQLQPKLILAEDVRQVLDYVVRGEVQAGVVYASDAFSAGGKVRVAARAPEDSHDPILYPIAVVKESRQREAAQKFVDLVVSSDGQNILTRYGFMGVK